MKKAVKVLLLSMGLLSGMHAFGQTAKYDKVSEEISLDGEYYAKLVKVNFNAVGIIKNYSIQNRQGDELMFFKYSPYREWDDRNNRYVDKAAYEITFINGKGKVYMKKQFTVNSVMKLLTTNNLIKNDKIDPEAEVRFISVNNGRQGRNKEVDVEASDISLSENEIVKEGTTIGKFIQQTETDGDGINWTVINVYSTTGGKIATAKTVTDSPMEWSVYTVSDKKTQQILYDESNPVEKLFSWMVSAKYIH